MFDKLATDGALQIDDPHLAATQFNWLLMAEPLERAMLLGIDDTPPAAELDRYAEHAVRTFLATHRTAQPDQWPQMCLARRTVASLLLDRSTVY